MTKFILPLLAVAGLAFAVFTVYKAQLPTPTSQPLQEPPKAPAEFKFVAGTGVVEAGRRNILVGTPVPGVVAEIYVKEGDKVTRDQPLFRIESRDLEADLKVRESMLASNEAQLARLRAGFREEDRKATADALRAALARFKNADVVYERSRQVFERGAGTQSEYDRDRYARDEARAALDKAEVEYQKMQNGSWIEDIRVAEAARDEAKAQLDRIRVELERRTIRSPMDAQVLQVNVLPGQFAALAWREPLLVLGDVERLHLRVDIDEQDLPMYLSGGRALATLKGRPGVRFELTPVRVDPYVIPKSNLRGDNAERVDTRVLQVIYALPNERPVDVYVGQQFDVYMEKRETSGLDLAVGPPPENPFTTPQPDKAASN